MDTVILPNSVDNLEQIRENILVRRADLLARRDELLESGALIPRVPDIDPLTKKPRLDVTGKPRMVFAPITSETVKGELSDLKNLITTCLKKAKTAHDEDKEPYLTGGQVVDSCYAAEWKGPLETLKTDILAALKEYMDRRAAIEQAELARQAREKKEAADKAAAEADRLAEAARGPRTMERAIEAETVAQVAQAAAETAQRATEMKPSALPGVRIRGEYSTTTLVRFTNFRRFEKADLSDRDMRKLLPHIAMEVLESATRKAILAGETFDGIVLFDDTRAR